MRKDNIRRLLVKLIFAPENGRWELYLPGKRRWEFYQDWPHCPSTDQVWMNPDFSKENIYDITIRKRRS